MSRIDDYLKKIEPSKRTQLQRVRTLAKEIVPSAEETVSYNIPTTGVNGLSQLQTHGFIVVPGPVPEGQLNAVSQAYDKAVASADTTDIVHGSTSVRVNDFVNRDRSFDPIYVHGPLLAAASELIGETFKLSAFHARSVRPHAAAQHLHQDVTRLPDGWPMVGFIFMVDEFRVDNGATRFVPGSQSLSAMPVPFERDHPHERYACGPAGSMIIFNGSVWHGHGANLTGTGRRSIQGALIRRDQVAAVDHPTRTRAETIARIGPVARDLLDL